MQHGTHLYVFDLDGVITNPENSAVNNNVLAKIHGILAGGSRVAVNTGRSYAWVEQNLVHYLESHNDASLFELLLVVCEKGGEMIHWQHGQSTVSPSKYALSKTDYDKVKAHFDRADNIDTMFWDDTKRTMATIEKYPSANLAEFHIQQQALTASLRDLFQGEAVKIDPTTIATDVESPQAGKYGGAEIIHEWASSGALEAACICFGDSISDYDMAVCFADKNLPTTFVYVGKAPEKLPQDARINVVVPSRNFDQGTLEYLT